MLSSLEKIRIAMDYSYSQYSTYFNVLLFVPMFLMVILAFLPTWGLECFSMFGIFDCFGERWRSDIAYLEVHDIKFLSAYSGYITLSIATFVMSYVIYLCFLFLSPDKIYMPDLWMAYLSVSSIIFTSFILFSYWLFLDNDFSFSERSVSWFVDNESTTRKLMPLPRSKFGLVVVGTIMAGIFWALTMLSRVFFVVIFGRRVKFEEIPREKVFS